MNDKAKPEPPLALDIDFGEALARFAQTKPEEVEPAPGQTKKAARPDRGRFATTEADPPAPHRNKTTPAAGTGG